MRGDSHDKFAAWAGAGLAIPLLVAVPAGGLLLMAAGYGAGVIWLSPDIDIRLSNPTNRWGIFKFLLKPYRRVFRRHRGMSHVPVLGSLGRLPYLLPAILPAVMVSGSVMPALWIALGLEVSSLVHILCDYTPGLNKL